MIRTSLNIGNFPERKHAHTYDVDFHCNITGFTVKRPLTISGPHDFLPIHLPNHPHARRGS